MIDADALPKQSADKQKLTTGEKTLKATTQLAIIWVDCYFAFALASAFLLPCQHSCTSYGELPD
jgi:hypothetical protein